MTPIAAGLAVAAGALLLAGLRRPPLSCEDARAAVAARCAELQAAQDHMLRTAAHHDSIDAGLRTALAAHIPNGPVNTAVQSLRRERHHARDQLSVARARAADAQRRYDEAVAAVPAGCGACPPCVSAAAARPLVTTPA